MVHGIKLYTKNVKSPLVTITAIKSVKSIKVQQPNLLTTAKTKL